MECHEGAKMIKTFRGLIADGAQDTIVLHTNDGSTGYRIVKFQLMNENPITTSGEHIMKIYKVSQTPGNMPGVTGTVDFSDNTLLGVGLFIHNDSYANTQTHIIFDQEIFNQDIYITHDTDAGSDACNYYIELEQIKLDLSESTVATLKDIRNEKRIAPA